MEGFITPEHYGIVSVTLASFEVITYSVTMVTPRGGYIKQKLSSHSSYSLGNVKIVHHPDFILVLK